MKKKVLVVLLFFGLLSARSEGEFIVDDATSITLIQPDGLCEGGIEGQNNTLIIPFEWSVSGDASITGFTLEIVERDNQTAQPQIIENIDGQLSEFQVTLDRGKFYVWKINGTLSSGEVVLSPNLEFYSETFPNDDEAPLPSQITILELQNSFEIRWTNDREETDNLNYQVWLSNALGPNAAIEDVSALNYVPQGGQRDESEVKILEISKNELNSNSDYVVRLETIKVVNNAITNRTFSYLKFTN